MKKLLLISLSLLLFSCGKKISSPPVQELISEQLKNSHSNSEWFVSFNQAVKGLTVDQANWKDSTENHSISQLSSHLLFWNKRILKAFKRENVEEFEGENTETFSLLDSVAWEKTKGDLDQVMIELEEAVANATPEQLEGWTSSLANVASHNAYHTGQILYIRKMKGWWDSTQGVQ